MSSAAEQFNAICKANLDAMRQFAAISLDSAENMLKLPLQAAREALVKDSEQLGAIWLGNSLSQALATWPAFYQENAQRALEMARDYWERAAKAQSELGSFIQDQAVSANRSFTESVQEIARAAVAVKPTTEHMEHKPRKVA
jgi:hypothetical protein